MAQLRSITSQMQQDSWLKSDKLELVVRAVWPLVSEDNYEDYPDEMGRAVEILVRANHLIGSDSYTTQRHNGISSMFSKVMLSHSSRIGDEEQFNKVLNAQFKSIDAQYASYGYSDPKRP